LLWDVSTLCAVVPPPGLVGVVGTGCSGLYTHQRVGQCVRGRAEQHEHTQLAHHLAGQHGGGVFPAAWRGIFDVREARWARAGLTLHGPWDDCSDWWVLWLISQRTLECVPGSL
jgi:hypothetical protein